MRRDDCGPAAIGHPLALRSQHEEVRAPVGRVRPLAHVATCDEPSDVIADRRRREPRLCRECARGHGLQVRDPPEKREKLLWHASPLELLVDEDPDEEACGIELLEEVGLTLLSLSHGESCEWTYCEFVRKIVRVRRYLMKEVG